MQIKMMSDEMHALEAGRSQVEILEERKASLFNIALDFILANIGPIIIVIVLLIIVIIVLICTGILKIESLGPIKFGSHKKNKSKARGKQRVDHLITDTPAPAPRDKDATLPIQLQAIDGNLKKNNRQRVLIQCDDHSVAEECGRLWFQDLYQSSAVAYNYIGWIDYENKNQDPQKKLNLAECFHAELSFLREEHKDQAVRYSKQMEYFRRNDTHTILFVNILEFPVGVERDLERYNNIPGLSLILISKQKIPGYETYTIK